MNLRHLLFPLLLVATCPARADVVPMNIDQLQHALQAAQPCCVIDARSKASRSKHPLDDALPYRDDLQITPTADVVVLADSDQQAQQVARRLAAAHPGKRMIAVRGGVQTWEAALVAASRSAAAGAPTGFGFVIPRNTCESGSPLQKLRSNHK